MSLRVIAAIRPGMQYTTATEPVLVITDHIGLPIQAIDPTGALVWDATAEPYGQLRGTLDTTHDPGLRYPGQWQDHIEA